MARPVHRSPAVAGSFYPEAASVLRAKVDALLASSTIPLDCPAPKALVVPHAGYVYSGAVAAAAYALLRAAGSPWRHVVLIGPSHRVALPGLAVPSVDRFDSPLGSVPIDRALRQRALAHPAVTVSDRAHVLEHSLEVQLPFLQRVCGEFTLLPLVAGDVSPETVATVLEALWNGPETGIVVSTDLSHFHDADTARRLDRHTADRILDFDATLDGEDACGCAGLNGFLLLARHRGLRARTIALSDSSAVSGDESRVVGYGAFAFSVSVPAYA